MVHLKDFTSSVRKSDEISPTVENWLYGTRDLERRLSERVIFLCQYYDRIPKQALLHYADLLIEVLDSDEVAGDFDLSGRLQNDIGKFAESLEQSEDPANKEKGKLIQAAIQKKFKTHE
jgi:hypothetical protein